MNDKKSKGENKMKTIKCLLLAIRRSGRSRYGQHDRKNRGQF